jgi:RNA polymerase sigma-70 factor (ECF subfamily)
MTRAAFDELYRAHYHQILGLCRRMLGGAMDAEDAAQEAFMRAYRGFGAYKARDPFGPWIGTIASNYCIDVLRSRRRLSAVFSAEEPPEPEDPEANGAAPLIDAEDADTVARAVEALPERYRLPIVLAYYADADYDQIARALGISRNHVGVLLLRGRERLRRDLNRINEEDSR